MYGLMDYYEPDIQLTEEEISGAGHSGPPMTATAATRGLFTELLREARRLARAKAVCKALPVAKATGRQLFLEGGQVLTSSLLARLAGPAESLLVAVLTLGEAIDRRVEEYNKSGLAAHAYFLDVAGSYLIDAAGRRLTEEIRAHLKGRGLEATIPLGPGHSYWKNLQDQKVIYSLADPSKIGVRILDSGMMLPKKTLSMVMGIGRGLPPSKNNHCHYCDLGQKCPLSRAKTPDLKNFFAAPENFPEKE